MLGEERCGPALRKGHARDLERDSRVDPLAGDRVVDLDEGVQMTELRVCQGVHGAGDDPRGHPRCLKRVHHVDGFAPGGPVFHESVQLICVPQPAHGVGKPLVLDPFGVVRRTAQAAPLLLGEHADGAPLIVTLAAIDTVWRRVGSPISHGLRLASVHRVLEVVGADEIGPHLHE